MSKHPQPKVVILTGAGISAESGIKTFRDFGGLWHEHRIEDVASLDGFIRNPKLVQSFYNARRAQLLEPQIQPNAAHFALAKLEDQLGDDLLIVTQNVDNLHERAGSKRLIHMHGELMKVRCQGSGQSFDWETAIEEDSVCACCQLAGTLRPHIVWFGEMPLAMDEIFASIETCETFVAIGTSGQVYPAAGFVNHVPQTSRTIEINPVSSEISALFKEHRRGPATVEVAKWVDEMLSQKHS